MLALQQRNFQQIVVAGGRNLLESAKQGLHQYLPQFVHLMAK
jgi:hypothetical protein